MGEKDLDAVMLGNLLSPERMIKKLLPIEVVVKVRIFRTKNGEIAVTFKEVEEKDESKASED